MADSDSLPPHMNPMSPDEVMELLKSTLHGDLPGPTVMRLLATLAEWAPKMKEGVTAKQQYALDHYEALMEQSAANEHLDTGEALEVMSALASSLLSAKEQ